MESSYLFQFPNTKGTLKMKYIKDLLYSVPAKVDKIAR